MRVVAAALASFLLLAGKSPYCYAQQSTAHVSTDRAHDNPEWANIAAHLPDPATASPATLEMAADTLRARRYPADAFRFYSAAMDRGGDPKVLLEKQGITCLEQQQIVLAHALFQRAVKLNRKNPSAWNNLGAAEFILHNNRSAIRDYRRAIKFGKNSASFHSNLALAYFDTKQMEDARHELAAALRLDPDLLHRNSEDGYTAQVLASESYPEICFEMARIYAEQGNVEAMLDWLTKASERGFDIHTAMDRDPVLRPMLSDARVVLLLKNTEVLRAKFKAPANVPGLGNANR